MYLGGQVKMNSGPLSIVTDSCQRFHQSTKSNELMV